ncbi:MAG: NUDIX hydrolase [Hyphomonadaceae bacterium]|uniref:NUDIX hydrolase n=1 Tax=Aquidulcibacter sp. TaxID=2052990 RepID=UPI0022C788E2|nr:NUDIX domain-containing protein [Aquidulcibacter sp.]MCZ8209467.1 NUDIX domain-containing protein [Aquidulcibacter sp.]
MDAVDLSVRQVGRVLIRNRAGEVYLLRGRDPGEPERPAFWFTPGGKIDPGETAQEAAARELQEEVGIQIEPAALGTVIGTEDVTYRFNGVSYRQTGVFFALTHETPQLHTDGLNALEAQTIDTGRWWSLAEIQSSQETIYPEHLGQILKDLQP